MAKTRKQKKTRGGDVKDGEYVYGINVDYTNLIDVSKAFPPVVYRHLGAAMDNAAVIGRKYLAPGHELEVNVTDPNDVVFQSEGSQMIVGAKGMNYLYVYIRRYKLLEEVSNTTKSEQRSLLGHIGKKKDLPPDTERIIAKMAGIQKL